MAGGKRVGSGPKPQPKAVAKAKGLYRPSRHDNVITDSMKLTFVEDEFPLPPEDLNEVECKYWTAAIGEAAKVSGWIGHVDLFMFKRWCVNCALLDELDEECRSAPKIEINAAGNRVQNPVFKMRETTEKTFIKLCSEFGFSPSSRTSIKLEQKEKEESKEPSYLI